MPNIKSQIKRDRQNLKRREKNNTLKSEIKTINKKFKKSLEEKDIGQAEGLLNIYFKTLDKAAKVNTVNKNFVANKKSKAAKALNEVKGTDAKSEKKDSSKSKKNEASKSKS